MKTKSRVSGYGIAFVLYLAAVPVALVIAAVIGYLRVTGDLAVCREYYPEMGRLECYFSSKTVRVPKE